MLANGPVAVAEIEVQARHAGLLAPTRQITGAKLFKQAKKVLDIRSKKIGFGAGGGWCRQWPETAHSTLSQSPEQPSTKDVPAGAIFVETRSDPEQSCAAELLVSPLQLPRSISKTGGVATWIDGVERLNYFRVPAGVPSQRWKQFIDDCKAFLDPLEGRAERAVERGWNTLDLFGSHPSRPLSYLGIAGLLWAVSGGRVIEIHRDWAVSNTLQPGRGAISIEGVPNRPSSPCLGGCGEDLQFSCSPSRRRKGGLNHRKGAS